MTTKATRLTDDAIRRAAIAKGWHDAAVTPQTVRSDNHDGGVWFILSARFKPDTDWQVIGRRRSRDELIAMIEGR